MCSSDLSDAEGYATLATPTVLALGYQVTREELEDNLYSEVSMPRAESLAFSMHTTIELTHANIFINGFSNNYVYGDGQPLFSNAHPTKSGTQSNLPTVNADLSEASLEDMIKRIYLAQNSRGLQINLRPRKLEIVSCPSCGRAQVDVYTLAEKVTAGLEGLTVPLRVAVMG